MAKVKTTDDLIAAVRSKLDEDNTAHIKDNEDIIPSLNRGLDNATTILAKKYESPLLSYYTQSLTSGLSEYDIPEDCYEDRIEKVEIVHTSDYIEVPRISYRDSTIWDSATGVPFPKGYYIIGKHIKFVPATSGEFSARIWYIKQPPQITAVQGRITSLNLANNYVLVDEVGDGISEDVDSMESFINVINGNTGEVRATFQIQYIENTKIKVKSSLDSDRTEVYGQTIQTVMTGLGIQLDDYICKADGSCILYLSQPLFNYVVQYAVAELRGEKLNEENQAIYLALDKLEKQVERTWVGRETDLKVKNKNKYWRKRGY